jgi:hypothetical protein
MVHLLKPFELFMTKAMKESVIPADTKLQRALESGRKGRLAKMLPAPATPAAEDFMPESETIAMQLPSRKTEPENFQPARSRLPALGPRSRSCAGKEASLIEA